jgi:hypothetical protein
MHFPRLLRLVIVNDDERLDIDTRQRANVINAHVRQISIA